jgi:hypothetical protein
MSDKEERSSKVTIALLQVIAVFMFVLVMIRLIGCTEEVSNVTVPEVIEATKKLNVPVVEEEPLTVPPIIITPTNAKLEDVIDTSPKPIDKKDVDEPEEDIPGC